MRFKKNSSNLLQLTTKLINQMLSYKCNYAMDKTTALISSLDNISFCNKMCFIANCSLHHDSIDFLCMCCSLVRTALYADATIYHTILFARSAT